MWRVYYDDGSVWDHTQGIEGMPSFGVMCILQNVLMENGIRRYHIVYSCPYYALVDGEWLHFYENDLIDYLTNNRLIQRFLVGRMVSKQVFGRAYEKAKADKDAENL